MFLSFCLANLIADNFIAEIRMLRCTVLYIIIQTITKDAEEKHAIIIFKH